MGIEKSIDRSIQLWIEPKYKHIAYQQIKHFVFASHNFPVHHNIRFHNVSFVLISILYSL